MKSISEILGIPIIENALLPPGTAFLIIQEKGVVTQMVEVYNTMTGLPTSELINELRKRRPCAECEMGNWQTQGGCKCLFDAGTLSRNGFMKKE